MIATVLNALGIGDDLPRSHADRAAELAARKAKIEAARSAETERLQVALVATREKATADTAAEEERFEAHAVKLADALAGDVVPALAPIFAAYTAEPSRKLLGTLAEQLRTFDARSRDELGGELQPMLVVASFASALVSANPKAASAFCSADAATGDALSSAARLVRAAVANADATALEGFATALEAALAKRVRYHGGREVTAEHREQWKAVATSGRASDRANRLSEIAEKHGAARQREFAQNYVPATGPIVPHERQTDAP